MSIKDEIYAIEKKMIYHASRLVSWMFPCVFPDESFEIRGLEGVVYLVFPSMFPKKAGMV